jgi:sensor histidine kinase YesM
MLSRSSCQIMGYIAINYSSPTLAAAIGNLVPAFTFMLAVIFRFANFILIYHISHPYEQIYLVFFFTQGK